MKNRFKLFGIIALVAVMFTGCAMLSTINGTADPQGFFTGNGATNKAIEGFTEVGSYTVILGIVTSGYDEYVAAVNAAAAQGRQIRSVTKWLFVMTRTTAYAR
jgi:hypothetical protein